MRMSPGHLPDDIKSTLVELPLSQGAAEKSLGDQPPKYFSQ